MAKLKPTMTDSDRWVFHLPKGIPLTAEIEARFWNYNRVPFSPPTESIDYTPFKLIRGTTIMFVNQKDKWAMKLPGRGMPEVHFPYEGYISYINIWARHDILLIMMVLRFRLGLPAFMVRWIVLQGGYQFACE